VMSNVGATELRSTLGEVLGRVQYAGERVVVERSGKAVAALIPIEDLRALEGLEDRLDLEEAELALRESAGEPTIPLEQVKKELGL
jgi:prevent-host-death family protein